MAEATWKIYWNEYTANTYMYGSKIIFHSKKDVEIQNDLMPSGTVIKRWYSKVNYQAARIEPSLPMIDGESTYTIQTDISGTEEGSYLLRLIFYDKYEAQAGSMIIRDREATFRCPLKTYSYELQLINAGTRGFHFHSIRISEIEK